MHLATRKIWNFRRRSKKLMDKILSYEKPVIVVNMAGSAMNLSAAQEKGISNYSGVVSGRQRWESSGRCDFWREISIRKAACNIL